MSGYTKVFSSLLASTVWLESPATRVVWLTILLMKGRDQVVEGTVPGLARIAGVTVEECRVALGKFMGPDAESRSKEHGGRRLLVVEGGWYVVNGEKYRKMLGHEERREYQRVKQAQYREKRKVGKEREEKLERAFVGAPKTVEERVGEAVVEKEVEWEKAGTNDDGRDAGWVGGSG